MVKLICILTQFLTKRYVTGSTGRSFTWHSGQAPAVSCLLADWNQEGTVASVRPVFFNLLIAWFGGGRRAKAVWSRQRLWTLRRWAPGSQFPSAHALCPGSSHRRCWLPVSLGLLNSKLGDYLEQRGGDPRKRWGRRSGDSCWFGLASGRGLCWVTQKPVYPCLG